MEFQFLHARTTRRFGMLPRAFIACAVVSLFGACSTFEETGGAQRANEPAPDIQPQSNASIVPADTSDTTTRGAALKPPPRRVRPKVTRGQDTVRASTSRTSRTSVPRSPFVKPPNAMYTVQVGAFQRATHALEMLKKLKTLHPDRPVFNNYSATDKMYRISVGKFETLREASNYRKILMNSGKKPLYSACWVTYIQR